MKKLIMLTLTLVALSSSSLFGARVQTRPVPVLRRQTQPYQTAPTQTGFIAPEFQKCLEEGNSPEVCNERMKQDGHQDQQKPEYDGKGVIYY